MEHPRWRVRPVANWRLDVDFGLLYGPPWEQLATRRPLSVIHAEGSAVRVYRHAPLVLASPPPPRRAPVEPAEGAPPP